MGIEGSHRKLGKAGVGTRARLWTMRRISRYSRKLGYAILHEANKFKGWDYRGQTPFEREKTLTTEGCSHSPSKANQSESKKAREQSCLARSAIEV